MDLEIIPSAEDAINFLNILFVYACPLAPMRNLVVNIRPKNDAWLPSPSGNNSENGEPVSSRRVITDDGAIGREPAFNNG